MSSVEFDAESIKSTIQNAFQTPLSDKILGISFGYAIDAGGFSYIRATIHTTDVSHPEISILEDRIRSYLERRFKHIPIFHVDASDYTKEDLVNSDNAINWAYRSEVA